MIIVQYCFVQLRVVLHPLLLSMRNQKKFLPCTVVIGLENNSIMKDHTTRYHFGKES
jgi:hypothetical protein